MKNKNITAKFIARHFFKKFVTDPHYSLTSLQQKVMNEFVVSVPLSKCYRAKEMALEVVYENHKEQYCKIYE